MRDKEAPRNAFLALFSAYPPSLQRRLRNLHIDRIEDDQWIEAMQRLQFRMRLRAVEHLHSTRQLIFDVRDVCADYFNLAVVQRMLSILQDSEQERCQ